MPNLFASRLIVAMLLCFCYPLEAFTPAGPSSKIEVDGGALAGGDLFAAAEGVITGAGFKQTFPRDRHRAFFHWYTRAWYGDSKVKGAGLEVWMKEDGDVINVAFIFTPSGPPKTWPKGVPADVRVCYETLRRAFDARFGTENIRTIRTGIER